jgi:hypothetical protein
MADSATAVMREAPPGHSHCTDLVIARKKTVIKRGANGSVQDKLSVALIDDESSRAVVSMNTSPTFILPTRLNV